MAGDFAFGGGRAIEGLGGYRNYYHDALESLGVTVNVFNNNVNSDNNQNHINNDVNQNNIIIDNNIIDNTRKWD